MTLDVLTDTSSKKTLTTAFNSRISPQNSDRLWYESFSVGNIGRLLVCQQQRIINIVGNKSGAFQQEV